MFLIEYDSWLEIVKYFFSVGLPSRSCS